jgi:small subunit ribosomal protein S4
MARNLGPKHKLSRREGVNLTGTTSASLQRRMDVPPGGVRNIHRRPSDYAIHLRAKQRAKREYGMTEQQFFRFFKEARKMPGPTGLNLLQLLERRLDNTVYRLGLARTRPMARQLVSHRHVLVNSQRINIPSYQVKPGDVITLDERALRMPLVQEELEARRMPLPSWLAREGNAGRVVALPKREDSPADISENLIVEFYAR